MMGSRLGLENGGKEGTADICKAWGFNSSQNSPPRSSLHFTGEKTEGSSER